MWSPLSQGNEKSMFFLSHMNLPKVTLLCTPCFYGGPVNMYSLEHAREGFIVDTQSNNQ